MADWNIRPRGRVCSLCGKSFEDKQQCVSALRELETGGFDRVDSCRSCWDVMERDWKPFSLWEGAFEAPQTQVREEPVKKDDAEDIFRKLLALEDPSQRNVVYILAVMLERSKRLVERASKLCDDGNFVRIYEHRKTGDTFMVVDPRLNLDALGQVQREVIDLLSGIKTLQDAPTATDAEAGA
jgi:hypothetical protein